jgi:predicted transposase YdaD
MRTRIDPLSDRPLAAKLWSATYVLMGLRFDQALIENVLSGVQQMEESVTYQAILQRGEERGRAQGRVEGRAEGAKEARVEEAAKLLLRQGSKKFGVPSESQHTALRAITDLAHLEALVDRILDVSTWDELLAGA